MKIKLLCYKSKISKDPLVEEDLSFDEACYLFHIVDKEMSIKDALYGLASGTRKEWAMIRKLHFVLKKLSNIKSEKNV